MVHLRSATVCALLSVLLISIALSVGAVSTRYLDVEIETFRPWGFLGWGVWEPLDARFVSMEIARPGEADLQQLEAIEAACRSNAAGDPGACTTASTVEYIFERNYTAVPILEARYRVRLTNQTETLLGVVLEIDGLNTNGGLSVSGMADDKKWVLLPGQSVLIAGWQVSTDEALAFRFETPSHTHSPQTNDRGHIRVYVYLPEPEWAAAARGTEAGELIAQPTVRIPFTSATSAPVDTLDFSYGRPTVSLGILCEDTEGPGIRITEVAAGTVAEVKGLRAGDVVTYINAVPINRCSEYQAYLATKSPGDRLVLKVHRPERTFLVTLELEE